MYICELHDVFHDGECPECTGDVLEGFRLLPFEGEPVVELALGED